MTTKEIGELKRRLKIDRTNLTAVYGCYVSGGGEILSQFRQGFGPMAEEDKEKYLAIFRRVLSGGLDKNLLDLSFSTSQVADSDEHRLLMRLRDSALEDDEARQALYEAVISGVHFEDNYLILLAHENYDVPFKARDGAVLDDGSAVFSYFLCAVCPVRPGKEALSYDAEEKQFHNRTPGWAASMPEAGFLFPAFDARRSNLYNCLFYTKSAKDNHPELAQALFRLQTPPPFDDQRGLFAGILHETLAEDCSLELVQQVQEALSQRIEVHKQAAQDEPLSVDAADMKEVLEAAGVPEEKRLAFGAKFEEAFGVNAAMNPKNLLETAKTQLKTPDVVISVAKDRQDLVQTRTLGGVKYLLIRAEEGVSLNGVELSVE